MPWFAGLPIFRMPDRTSQDSAHGPARQAQDHDLSSVDYEVAEVAMLAGMRWKRETPKQDAASQKNRFQILIGE